MKRKKTIKVKNHNGSIAIVIDVDGTGHLSRNECDGVAEKLTDIIMRAIPDLPYVNTHLSKIKVF